MPSATCATIFSKEGKRVIVLPAGAGSGLGTTPLAGVWGAKLEMGDDMVQVPHNQKDPHNLSHNFSFSFGGRTLISIYHFPPSELIPNSSFLIYYFTLYVYGLCRPRGEPHDAANYRRSIVVDAPRRRDAPRCVARAYFLVLIIKRRLSVPVVICPSARDQKLNSNLNKSAIRVDQSIASKRATL